jgi:hypothetical protein
MQDLFHILPSVAAELGEDDTAREALVFAAWRRAAGDALSEHTMPIELRQKRLVVAVANRMWQRHLQDLSGQILFKLNALLGSASITYIEFCIDEAAASANLRSAGADRKDGERLASLEVTAEMRQAAKAIKDNALRDQFLMAAGSCLARLKRLEEKI